MEATSDGKKTRRSGEHTEKRILDENRRPAPLTHKKSLSGSLFSKLSFLRSSEQLSTESEEVESPEGGNDGKEEAMASPASGRSAIASALRETRNRRRRGSLRKTAILGTGRLRMEDRQKKHSNLDPRAKQEPESPVDPVSSPEEMTSPDFLASDDMPTPRPSTERSRASVVPAPAPVQLQKRAILNDITSDESLLLPQVVRRQTMGDLSTTDDDDNTLLMRSSHLSNGSGIMKKSLGPSVGGSSYFPAEIPPDLARRRSSQRAKSPLATLPLEPVTPPEEWDYADTEWWGWVVLVVTWIVFVVGMGSCFGVWSWAWDVGETPYAPPELEDDPTLPIVGYYPALIILTAVMAWVWVVVAWVGMKYFKHARIPGEEG
ncbi:hypothetical protein MMC25_001456 [Agyrium rufum]|nr:hypothetical protein [Agyrium rufum]